MYQLWIDAQLLTTGLTLEEGLLLLRALQPTGRHVTLVFDPQR